MKLTQAKIPMCPECGTEMTGLWGGVHYHCPNPDCAVEHEEHPDWGY